MVDAHVIHEQPLYVAHEQRVSSTCGRGIGDVVFSPKPTTTYSNKYTSAIVDRLTFYRTSLPFVHIRTLLGLGPGVPFTWYKQQTRCHRFAIVNLPVAHSPTSLLFRRIIFRYASMSRFAGRYPQPQCVIMRGHGKGVERVEGPQFAVPPSE